VGTLGNGWSVAGTGDFNADGRSDILLENGQTLAEWQMNGTTILGTSGNVGTLASCWSVAGVGDFNGDDNSEILLENGQTLAEWQMNGTTILGSSDNIGTLGGGFQPVKA
jgi:hypothetical protein